MLLVERLSNGWRDNEPMIIEFLCSIFVRILGLMSDSCNNNNSRGKAANAATPATPCNIIIGGN